MENSPSFDDHVLVSCGTLRPELDRLQETGFLNPQQILYTTPGLHEDYRRLKEELTDKLQQSLVYSEKIIVVYGSSCYVDLGKEPPEDIDSLISKQEGSIIRIQATRCIDMLAGSDQRERISGGEKVYWLTPGWLKYWQVIFRDWDPAKANETFPRYDKAILLDGVGFYDSYVEEFSERVLEFSDWMKIPIQPKKVHLDRFKKLLAEQI